MQGFHAGKLNRRIKVRKRSITLDSYGEETIMYSVLATLWADVSIRSGREFWAAQKINAELSGIIYIRYRTDITEDMIIEYNGKYYEITAPPIDFNDRREYLRLEVKEMIDFEYGVS